jgi:hypothetical protein
MRDTGITWQIQRTGGGAQLNEYRLKACDAEAESR